MVTLAIILMGALSLALILWATTGAFGLHSKPKEQGLIRPSEPSEWLDDGDWRALQAGRLLDKHGITVEAEGNTVRILGPSPNSTHVERGYRPVLGEWPRPPGARCEKK